MSLNSFEWHMWEYLEICMSLPNLVELAWTEGKFIFCSVWEQLLIMVMPIEHVTSLAILCRPSHSPVPISVSACLAPDVWSIRSQLCHAAAHVYIEVFVLGLLVLAYSVHHPNNATESFSALAFLHIFWRPGRLTCTSFLESCHAALCMTYLTPSEKSTTMA